MATTGWGLLWFDDDDKKPFAIKVQEAAQKHLKKYGRRPNVCYVNKAQMEGHITRRVGDITVMERKGVLPNNFFVGIERGNVEGTQDDSQAD